MKILKCGIIGASGYAGSEVARLLLAHPYAQLCAINARSYIGQPISNVYPGFNGCTSLVFEDEDSVIQKSECLFVSLPHGLSEPLAKKCMDQGKKMIDLGADFRLYEEADYKEWYHLSYQDIALHKKSVYGLSEINRADIKGASLVGNPGCYPTSIGLAMYPLLRTSLADTSHIIIDAKSGTTGAGKEASENAHFPRRNEAFGPYKVAQHRHTPEIEQTLTQMSGTPTKITFVPHLLPISRGIISTIYVNLKESITPEQLQRMYEECYKEEPFVRVLPQEHVADLKFVQHSNYCDISLHLDTRHNTLIIVSAIDNMIKGAAGQAIQNMNIMYGYKEDCALTMIAPSF